MDQLTVVGRRSIARELLQSLQSLGVVQIDPLDPMEGSTLESFELEGKDLEESNLWSSIVGRSETLLAVLGASDVEAASKSEIPAGAQEIQAYLGEVEPKIESIIAERARLRDDLDLIRTYLPIFRTLAPTLAQLESSRYLAGRAFLVSSDGLDEVRRELSEALDDRIAFASRTHGRQVLVVAAVLKDDESGLVGALSRAGISPLALPGRYAEHGVAKAVHVMEERSQNVPRRLSNLETELGQLREANAAKLQAIHVVALNHQNRYQVTEDLLAGRYTFALRGWMPSEDSKKVAEALRRQFGSDIALATREADEHHDANVPVKLDNPGWVKPFELLLSLFAPPRYGSFDPSWTLAVFFPLFFGIIVGDFGFGLLFLALGMWLTRRGKSGKNLDLGPLNIVIPASSLPAIGTIVNWAGFWSVVWGLVFGEGFGNFFERWPAGNPLFYPPSHGDNGILPIAIFRVEEFTPLFIITLGFGVFQVLFGWAIRAWQGLKHGDMKHFWEGVGMIAGLAALVVFATAYLYGAISTWVLVVSGIGLAIFLVSVVLAQLPLMLVELISNSGHILSYLRLFAVGLSAALVANLATDLGFAINNALGVPVIGALIGMVTALVVHLAAITLTLIGHTLQPLRLQYVEFFTKFGFYDSQGRPYKPFRLLGGKA